MTYIIILILVVIFLILLAFINSSRNMEWAKCKLFVCEEQKVIGICYFHIDVRLNCLLIIPVEENFLVFRGDPISSKLVYTLDGNGKIVEEKAKHNSFEWRISKESISFKDSKLSNGRRIKANIVDCETSFTLHNEESISSLIKKIESFRHSNGHLMRSARNIV